MVRHTSPTIAEDLDVLPSANAGRTYLAWVGIADELAPDTASNMVCQEYRIFYGDDTGGVGTHSVYGIEHDLATPKRNPSMTVYQDYGLGVDRMWMFWQSGEKGRWAIDYSTSDSAGHNSASWADDAQLRTPDMLASVSSPNVIHRSFWVGRNGSKPDYSNARNLLDVVYSGVSKIGQNADIMLSRYMAITQSDVNVTSGGYSDNDLPSRAAQPLPRIYLQPNFDQNLNGTICGEKLQKDPNYGYYTAQHLAWVRPELSQVQLGRYTWTYDNWYTPNGSIPNTISPQNDFPYIRVVLSNGYNGYMGLAAGDIVSGTDGSIYDSAGNTIVAPSKITPTVDTATGIYTYSYSNPTTTAVLGKMIVDYSSGIVRFTLPFKEMRNSDGSYSTTNVYAQYTPRTWRLTTDPAADTSPRAFIDHTPMTTIACPGLTVPGSSTGSEQGVDRLWVFWRKAGTGVGQSSIYYKTYRVGVDLAQLGKPAIQWNPADGNVHLTPYLSTGNPTITNNFGPFEVDRTGTRIYFTEADERYDSLTNYDALMVASGAKPLTSSWPQPMQIQYTDINGKQQSVTVDDVYWINEMPDQSLAPLAVQGNVNEDSIWAFADPGDFVSSGSGGTGQTSGTLQPPMSSKIWLFWTSTAGGTSNLFWETLCPNFAAR